ncbi:MAG: PPOX class F420-dependent oxidoreductase [Chloroflexi bacterium]|nr:MAG: PPOX class F420-dependent oxidoreductase [Chloroflexota bacterium]TMD81830.1 MAG: PPOX class F420-dependent oxidoreductase [Chloroflexota bacterium]
MAGGGNAIAAVSPTVLALVAQPILTVVGTKRADGSLQLNPAWFEFDDGYFWLNSNRWRTWPKNVQRDRDITLNFIDASEPFRWASIRGRLAEVIPDPDHAFIDRLARRYTGRVFRELRPGEERITLKVEPVSVTGEMI